MNHSQDLNNTLSYLQTQLKIGVESTELGGGEGNAENH